ncbi:MAG: hypothetical protein KDD55_05805 [Bdellovibrionales bacterium]|nr:hypothetical protein [Bdellovibrionales bacterium]
MGNLSLAEELGLKSFEAPRYQLSLHYPDSLISLPPPIPQSLLFLRHKDALHPTFNIVSQPRPTKESKKSLKKQVRQLLNSYREVGLTDTKLIDYHEISVSGHEALSASLRFSQGEVAFRSNVTVIPLQSNELIFTYIDRYDDYEKNGALWKLLLSSISLPQELSQPEKIKAAPSNTLLWNSLAAILGLFAVFLMWRWTHSRKSSP